MNVFKTVNRPHPSEKVFTGISIFKTMLKIYLLHYPRLMRILVLPQLFCLRPQEADFLLPSKSSGEIITPRRSRQSLFKAIFDRNVN